MRRLLVALAGAVALLAAYALAHWTLIEVGREVIVLRTEEADGSRYTSRLWIVDVGGTPWLHGDRGSRWEQNLAVRPVVEVVRGGETRRWRAVPVPGPHPEIDAALRSKYGVADVWVRFVARDGDTTTPVRLEPVAEP